MRFLEISPLHSVFKVNQIWGMFGVFLASFVMESNVLMLKGTSAVTVERKDLVLTEIGDRQECNVFGVLFFFFFWCMPLVNNVKLVSCYLSKYFCYFYRWWKYVHRS